MIPLGDIDLQREVFLNNTGVINHQPERARIRRLYTAKIVGRKSDVAVYQGEGAQEVFYIAFSLYCLFILSRNGGRTYTVTHGFGTGRTVLFSKKMKLTSQPSELCPTESFRNFVDDACCCV
jgi:hypothetical protein